MFDNVIPIIPERYAGNAIPAITTKEDHRIFGISFTILPLFIVLRSLAVEILHDASLAGNLITDRSPI